MSEVQFLLNFPPGVTQLYLSLFQAQPKTSTEEAVQAKHEEKKKKRTTSPYHFSLTLHFETQYLFSEAQEGDSACWVLILYFKMLS